VHVECAIRATRATELRAAIDGAGPVGREVAGIEAGKLRIELPGQRRRPRQFAAALQPAAGHARAQLPQAHSIAVADRVEIQLRAAPGARQRRLAERRPLFRRAGKAEIAVRQHLRLALAPFQALRLHFGLQARVFRDGEIRLPGQRDASVHQLNDQRLQVQSLALDAQA
jgi:hypothetical protein